MVRVPAVRSGMKRMGDREGSEYGYADSGVTDSEGAGRAHKRVASCTHTISLVQTHTDVA
jgi:hypothetical protein